MATGTTTPAAASTEGQSGPTTATSTPDGATPAATPTQALAVTPAQTGTPATVPGSVPPAPAAPTPPAPAPAPAPTIPAPDRYAPVAGSEPAPSLVAPQPGSTAEVGVNGEGIYEDMWGFTLVGAQGSLVRRGLLDWTWGSISVTGGSNWVFNGDTRSLGFIDEPVIKGSGTFSAKASMDGSYARDGRSSQAWGPLKYSNANALAVSQQSVAGKWGVSESNVTVSIKIDEKGVLTGTTGGSEFGTCKLWGTLLQSEPKTAKNMYDLTLNTANAATGTQKACELDTAGDYAGPSAIYLTGAGDYVGNGYFRSLVMIAKSPRYVMTMYLDKQQ
ncbi:hypothetical protein [Variovorax sp. dw_308]|uniref:hypothetical protein n=1 Tax=Variovorax sp. dw_308 TaxID=2721546 RepID=UPI001C455FEA|nr:hypothetical protein [Variovorax sp. dw_308]